MKTTFDENIKKKIENESKDVKFQLQIKYFPTINNKIMQQNQSFFSDDNIVFFMSDAISKKNETAIDTLECVNKNAPETFLTILTFKSFLESTDFEKLDQLNAINLGEINDDDDGTSGLYRYLSKLMKTTYLEHVQKWLKENHS
ncbi:MAG: hypothetical protein HON94_11255 [Methylococcales bacterium]|nr:hypothetical protein [Methylococcales bacterium]MBT7409118.1 hypothetical protein [Methylococcales bacterium]